MIEVKNVTKNYGRHRVLDSLSFSVRKGDVVGFLGPNGAGKTTTMDILCGCIGADAGTVKICDYDIAENPIAAKKRLAYLPDTPALYDDMRVFEMIRYSARINSLSSHLVGDAVDEIIGQLDLASVRSKLIGNLSKGYRQRVALANSLVYKPEVLVLDEPTEGLDPNQIIQMRNIIRGLKGNHTILLSSHILHEIASVCDSIMIISDGQIVAQGTQQELEERLIQKTYRLEVRKFCEEKISKFEDLFGLQNFEIETTGSILFSVEDEVVIDSILEFILKEKMGIRSLETNGSSLEGIFHQLTH